MTTVPGATASTAANSLLVPANASPTASVSVAVPPATSLGTYAVRLTATSGAAPALSRSNTATITVVDKLAPALRVSTPTDGATFVAGERVPAVHAYTEETNGSGLNSCAGPVGSGTPIDTATPGQKTFTVTGSDAAGNTATTVRTYTVVAPAAVPAAPGPRINFTLGFDFPSATASTKFTLLQAKGAPPGAIVEVICKGRSCPATRLAGKRRAVRFTARATAPSPSSHGSGSRCAPAPSSR